MLGSIKGLLTHRLSATVLGSMKGLLTYNLSATVLGCMKGLLTYRLGATVLCSMKGLLTYRLHVACILLGLRSARACSTACGAHPLGIAFCARLLFCMAPASRRGIGNGARQSVCNSSLACVALCNAAGGSLTGKYNRNPGEKARFNLFPG